MKKEPTTGGTGIDRVLFDLECGNLTDAQTAAKRYSLSKLQIAFIDRGMPQQLAYARANYLKNCISFQTLCDIEFVLKDDKK